MSAAATGARPSGMAAWKLAVRLPTLTAAVAPVLVGSAVAYHEDGFRLGPALAALFGALCLQVGANLANDVFDFRRGADTGERLGPPRVTQQGMISPGRVLTAMWLAFALATAAGVYLVAVAGWPVVAVGLASIAAAIVYTGGPWPIGYHALGDLFAFVFFGLVAVVGTTYVQTLDVPPLAWVAALPVACTVTAILVVNNLRDIETDRAAGKTTLAVVMGDRGTRAWFVVLVVVAQVVPLAAWPAGPLSFPVLLTPLALLSGYRPLLAVAGGQRGRVLNQSLKDTARYHLVLAVLTSVAIVTS